MLKNYASLVLESDYTYSGGTAFPILRCAYGTALPVGDTLVELVKSVAGDTLAVEFVAPPCPRVRAPLLCNCRSNELRMKRRSNSMAASIAIGIRRFVSTICRGIKALCLPIIA